MVVRPRGKWLQGLKFPFLFTYKVSGFGKLQIFAYFIKNETYVAK